MAASIIEAGSEAEASRALGDDNNLEFPLRPVPQSVLFLHFFFFFFSLKDRNIAREICFARYHTSIGNCINPTKGPRQREYTDT